MRARSLRMKIFLSMIFLVLGASILIAVVTIYQYKADAQQYHKERLDRKEESVRASINYQLRQTTYEVITENIPLIFRAKIYEIQDIHNLEIVLYDLEGNLLKSSKAAFFEDVNLKIPKEDLNRLKASPDKRFVKRFKEDGQNYQASYTYITDNYFKPLAILSLPYIEDDGMMDHQLNMFLIRLVEVYFIMILISVLMSYLLSKQITKSLQSITEKIKSTRLDKVNKKIEVKNAGHEVAIVIDAYNSMIDQLEESATALATNERESAWREMAKQVAHEIKNPLTPMRLTLQSFERRFDPNDPEIQQKVKEFSKTMIQQIDTMSSIASAFSTYAKMPAQQDETLNLVKITKLALDIFNEAFISFSSSEKNIRVKMDRTQWIRIVTNLVKNAVQAVSETDNPQVLVEVNATKDKGILVVSDNGIGIPPENKSKVFEPKFTTKTSGMGLGLAMVKNIVESHDGTISLVSEVGKGTTFTVEFPIFTS